MGGVVSVALEEGTQKRQRVMVGISIVVFLTAAVVAWYVLGSGSPATAAANRGFICAECSGSFDHNIQMGETEPIGCEACGKKAAYQAEACYWTKGPGGEWKAKLQPTYVLLKSKVDPATREKTYCPDCGHVVVGHNPPPPDKLMEEAEAESKK